MFQPKVGKCGQGEVGEGGYLEVDVLLRNKLHYIFEIYCKFVYLQNVHSACMSVEKVKNLKLLHDFFEIFVL